MAQRLKPKASHFEVRGLCLDLLRHLWALPLGWRDCPNHTRRDGADLFTAWEDDPGSFRLTIKSDGQATLSQRLDKTRKLQAYTGHCKPGPAYGESIAFKP